MATENRKVMCRACLAMNVKYHKLDTPLDEHGPITLQEAFASYTQLRDAPGLPTYLCTKCCDALRVCHKFIQHATEAHKVLLNRNGSGDAALAECSGARAIRFRCKICGATVESKKSLKEHVELHLDLIFYSCQMCHFQCKKRSQLTMHYISAHRHQPTREQLKPKAADHQPAQQMAQQRDRALQSNDVEVEEENLSASKRLKTKDDTDANCGRRSTLKVNWPQRAQMQTTKYIKCKRCAEQCISHEKLKLHMLTHQEIPHFLCDACTFVTFFKMDLLYHYKLQHQVAPTQRQLQPRNKVRALTDAKRKSMVDDGESYAVKHVFNCDLCLYETNIRSCLRHHYLSEHQVNASDVQLRPTIAEAADLNGTRLTPLSDRNNATPKLSDAKIIIRSEQTNRCLLKPDYPNGLQCKACDRVFYSRTKLSEHYRQQHANDAASIEQNATPTNCHPIRSAGQTSDVQDGSDRSHGDAAFGEEHIEVVATTTLHSEVNAPIGTAVHTVPLDAVPQVVEMDIIENNFGYNFNGDVFFEDFDEETDVTDDDVAVAHDFLLTSDSEDDNAQQVMAISGSTRQETYCIHCNRTFATQYQFENHMFVHRGLAPYRCEMCTNLYNTKRALIRHYGGVHKILPTRDMLQAKGDKINIEDNETPVEQLDLQPQKDTTFLCAKCSFETTDLACLQLHLKIHHGTSEDNHILKKLPFECPRCIRSFGTKVHLERHLVRSHVNTISIKHDATAANAVNEVICITTLSTQAPLTRAAPAITTNSNEQTRKLKMLFESDNI